jgi:hypothetical protein
MSSISFVKHKRFLNEPLQCTMREFARRYVAPEENTKIYENAYDK